LQTSGTALGIEACMNIKRIAHLIGNLIGVGFFLLFVIASVQGFQKTHSILSLGVVLVNSLMLTVFCLRREATAVVAYPFAWIMGLMGVVLSLLFRPSGADILPILAVPADIVQLFGLTALGFALVSLKRSFGVVAAHRKIQTGGLYRWVRHPVYASEILFFFGYCMANQSLSNTVTLILVIAVQYSRIRIEENFLGQYPAYMAYMANTRYRLIPGIL
jgi:protein-S-isoprenylcysteine O-methyltransferase Ste14